jgi:hypothetical protein
MRFISLETLFGKAGLVDGLYHYKPLFYPLPIFPDKTYKSLIGQAFLLPLLQSHIISRCTF